MLIPAALSFSEELWLRIVEAGATTVLVTIVGGLVVWKVSDSAQRTRADRELRTRLVREASKAMSELNIATASYWYDRLDAAGVDETTARFLDDGAFEARGVRHPLPDHSELDRVHRSARATLEAIQHELASYGSHALAKELHQATDCLTMRYFLAVARASANRRSHYSAGDESDHTGVQAEDMAGSSGWTLLGKTYAHVSPALLQKLAATRLLGKPN